MPKNQTSFGPNNNANPNGRPKKGESLSEVMRTFLEQIPEGQEKTYKELFVSKSYSKAYEGDPTFAKLIWNYMDGMPKQSLEHSGPDGGPIQVLPILGSLNVHTNDSDQEDSTAQ